MKSSFKYLGKKKINWKHNNKFWSSKKYLNHISKKFVYKNKQININILFAFLNVITLFGFKKKINVFDFGGGTGLNYNKNFLNNNSSHKFIIYDNYELTKIGNKYNKNKNLSFINTTQLKTKKIDIVFISSVLQYMNKVATTLKKMTDMKPKCIILEDFFAHDNEDFILEENFLGSNLFFKVHNLEKLINLMNKNNYKLIFKSPYVPYVKGRYEFYSIVNLPKKLNIIYSYNLIFVKK